MHPLRHGLVRRVGLGVASLAGLAILAAIALLAWLAVRVAGAHQLATARDRFESEVGRLPHAKLTPATARAREAAFLERLGGPARLPGEADLGQIRALLWRAPSTWSPAEVVACRRFLAANASLAAAADRAAAWRATAPAGGEALPWHPGDAGALLRRAGAQATLSKARVRLALRDRSYAEMRRGMDALAAGADAFAAQPGMFLQLITPSLERALLQAMAWIVEDPDVGPRDLAALRRLLPQRPLPAVVRRLFAGEAGYLLTGTDVQPLRHELSDADLARVLDGYRRLAAELAPGPSTILPAVSRTATPVVERPSRPRTLPALLLTLVRPSFESIVEQLAAGAAARQLAAAALDLRLAGARDCAYPPTLASLPLARQPDPFTGQPPHYHLDAQGGALLANPRAAAAWQALPHCATTHSPPYEWRLPPPCAARPLAGTR